MPFYLALAFSLTIGIAAIIALVRFKQINSIYHPFLYCTWIAFLTEIGSYLIVMQGYSNAVIYNIYVLIESLLITWQFRRWGLFKRAGFLYYAVLFSFILFWTIECFPLGAINYTISYFRLFYSFVIVLMSVDLINRQVILEKGNLLKNSIFLICVAYISYYTCKVIVDAFWLYGLSSSNAFLLNVTEFLIYINLFANLVFALAVLWMPTKHRFSLLS